jgi:hypothetical protein
MGRWERISERVAALPEAEREAVLDDFEARLAVNDADPLTDEQYAELDRRLANPGRILTREESALALARLRG